MLVGGNCGRVAAYRIAVQCKCKCSALHCNLLLAPQTLQLRARGKGCVGIPCWLLGVLVILFNRDDPTRSNHHLRGPPAPRQTFHQTSTWKLARSILQVIKTSAIPASPASPATTVRSDSLARLVSVGWAYYPPVILSTGDNLVLLIHTASSRPAAWRPPESGPPPFFTPSGW